MSARAVSTPSISADLLSLTKPRLSSLVLCTAAGGMWLAPGTLNPARMWVGLIAIAATIGAANAFNQYLERDSDRFMKRTRNRPLPSGRMEPQAALGFALALAVISVPLVALVTNPLTGALDLLALVSYVWAYTPMKSRNPWAMVMGTLPGALPPMMGWTAVTGRLDPAAWVLFAILVFWQLPHFLAIALFRKQEYAAAGLKSIPIAYGDRTARIHLVIYAACLLPISVLLYPLHVAGLFYLVVAVVLGTAFLAYSIWGAWKGLGNTWAKRLFFASLLYLTGLFIALMLNGIAR